MYKAQTYGYQVKLSDNKNNAIQNNLRVRRDRNLASTMFLNEEFQSFEDGIQLCIHFRFEFSVVLIGK